MKFRSTSQPKNPETVARIITGPETPEHSREEKALSGSFSRTILNLRLQTIQSLTEETEKLFGPKISKVLADKGMIGWAKTYLITTLGGGGLGDSAPLSSDNALNFNYMIARYEQKLTLLTWRNEQRHPVHCRSSSWCYRLGHRPFCDSHNRLNPPKHGEQCDCCHRIYQPGDVIQDAEDNLGVQDDAVKIFRTMVMHICRSFHASDSNIPVNLILPQQVPFSTPYGPYNTRIPISRRPTIQPAEESSDIQAADQDETASTSP